MCTETWGGGAGGKEEEEEEAGETIRIIGVAGAEGRMHA